MELASYHPSGVLSFEVASVFLEKVLHPCFESPIGLCGEILACSTHECRQTSFHFLHSLTYTIHSSLILTLHVVATRRHDIVEGCICWHHAENPVIQSNL
jgi:hypothetical protein